ncbi:MAG: HAD-IA family hydrolase [Patescibacteria group bacterium]|nr:HAD-IA family hydrolase [Patescibacteria group bacterium]MDE1966649.1 HAD-IA family hydrolase [Patescibacteria group bacterium]
MPKKQHKAVAFDFGGVIRLNDQGDVLAKVAHLLGVSDDAFREAYYQHNHLSNVQNAPWEDIVAGVARLFDSRPQTEKEVRKIIEEFRNGDYLNRELLDLLPRLRAKGLKTAIFSNAQSELRKYLVSEGIDKMVDEVVISGEIGHQKPHKEAFQVLFERLKVLPEEVAFIDDSKKSLEKASEIGYTPILFKDNQQLKSELASLGLM